MRRHSAEKLGNGTWRVTCQICGTVFIAVSAKAAYCSETCAAIGRLMRDPVRIRLVRPIATDRRRLARLRHALRSALADPDGYASGRLRIPKIGISRRMAPTVYRISIRKQRAAYRVKRRKQHNSCLVKLRRHELASGLARKTALRRRLRR